MFLLARSMGICLFKTLSMKLHIPVHDTTLNLKPINEKQPNNDINQPTKPNRITKRTIPHAPIKTIHPFIKPNLDNAPSATRRDCNPGEEQGPADLPVATAR